MKISKYYKYILIIIVAIVFIFIKPNKILALASNYTENGWVLYDEDRKPNNPGAAMFDSFDTIFSNILGMLISIGGVIVFIMFIVGGYKMMLAGGDPQKTAAAKGTITWAIIGLLFLIGSWFIMLLIKEFTGVDVTNIGIIINPAP